MAVEDNYPREECSPLHLADEISAEVCGEEVKGKERRRKKKSQSNYCDPEEIWKLCGSRVRGLLNGTGAE